MVQQIPIYNSKSLNYRLKSSSISFLCLAEVVPVDQSPFGCDSAYCVEYQCKVVNNCDSPEKPSCWIISDDSGLTVELS